MNKQRIVFAVCAYAILGIQRPAGASDIFETPVRLEADGKVIDTGDAWGHSSPCIEDIDGDGLADLLLGDFSGTFHVYKNIGENSKPVYKSAGKLQAGGEDASVRIYCCVGCQPRFVDLDGDGIRDFISSSYDPGHCYLFRGLPEHKFEKGQELVDSAGVPVRSKPQQQQNHQSFGSFYTPVDWDADGDFDILIGTFSGGLLLRVNEGTGKEAKFASENVTIVAGGEPLKVSSHCCPAVANWDADGMWDLVVGRDDGSVTWFRNNGDKNTPKFEKGEILVEKTPSNGYNLLRWSEAEIVPGIRAQVEVADCNGDGKLDLIVGDFCEVFDTKPDLTEEQKNQLTEIITTAKESGKVYGAKMEALRKDFTTRYPGDKVYSDEATDEWSKAYKELQESPEAKEVERLEVEFVKDVRPFLASVRGEGDQSHDMAKAHGYVWLFVRK